MNCFFSDSERRPSQQHKLRFFSWGAGSSRSSKKSSASQQPQAQSESCIEVTQQAVDTSQALPGSSSQRVPDLQIFSYAELRAATKNFFRGNLLGEGGFGCVYKGYIKLKSNGGEIIKEVAVKQLNRKGHQGHKEWLAEVRFLGLVEHPNLVKLVGYCTEDGDTGMQRMLVYEYMANKSLEEHLFQKGQTSILTWEHRLLILLGSARGLAYLHEGMSDIQVIFRDFKTSNVLLDKDFSPKLSDFGLARQGPETGNTHVSTAVVGTMGYAAPEYIQTGHLNAKSDVWSFGVVLLEMLSGRRSLDRNRPNNEKYLLDWIKPHLHGNNKTFESIMDPGLSGQYSLTQAKRIASLALQCLAKHARTRPVMSVVVERLEEIVELGNTPPDAMVHINPPHSNDLGNSDSTATKRPWVVFKDVAMRLRSKEDVRPLWHLWAPKAVLVGTNK